MSKHLPFIAAALLFRLAPIALAAPVQTHHGIAPLPPLQTAAAPRTAAPAAAGASAALYSGQNMDDAGITLAPWGGGDIKDDTTLALDGTDSLSVTTVDLYQGGRINFTTPVSLGDLTDKTRYLEMKLRFPKAILEAPQDQGGFGGFGGRRGRRGFGGFGGPGDASNEPPYNPDAPPVITSLRWVFTLNDGRQAEILRPLPDDAVMGNAWVTVAVPLSVLKFSYNAPPGVAQATAQLTDSALKSITITADGYGVFSIGVIEIVTDSQPLDAIAGDAQDVDAGNPVTLHGTGDGGASTLVFSWDFDTHGPFVDQAEGQTATTQYDTGGKDYVATLTVSDLDGIKAPVTATTTIHVH